MCQARINPPPVASSAVDKKQPSADGMERRRLRYLNFNAEDDDVDVKMDGCVVAKLILGNEVVSFKRIFILPKAEDFRASVDVRLDAHVSLDRAVKLTASGDGGVATHYDGIGRQIEVLKSPHNQTPLAERLRSDPSDEGSDKNIDRQVLANFFEDRKKKDFEELGFVRFRRRHVVYGSLGPVVWYELVDDMTDQVFGWAPSHDSTSTLEDGLGEDGGEGSGTRFVAEARHRRCAPASLIVIVVRSGILIYYTACAASSHRLTEPLTYRFVTRW